MVTIKLGAGIGAAALLLAAGAVSAGTEPADDTAMETAAAGTIPDPAECADGLTLADGTLTVGTGDPAFPPYVIDDDPESGEGFEAALVYAIAELLGFADEDVNWIRTPFDTVIAPGPKDFDFNIQQYSITDQRAEVVDFSLPYYTATQAIFGPADGPGTGATTLRDVQELRLGVATGTTSMVFAEDIIAPSGGVQIYDDNAGAVAALDAQQVDAVIADLPTALFVTAVQMDDGVVYGQFTTTDETEGESWGMLFEQDNPLVECVDNAILILRQTGELDEITDAWMTSSVDVPFIDLDG